MLIAALLLALSVQDGPALVPGGEDTALPPILPKPSCRPRPGEDVVICGSTDPSRFRAPLLDDHRYKEEPLRAGLRIKGVGEADIHAVQRGFPGASAPGAMITLKIPLGKKKDEDE